MPSSDQEDKRIEADRGWKLGVRARLLLAFLGIATFAILAAAAGIYAFSAVGGRLNAIDMRVPPTISAIELSRSAERIVAAAPALLAATDRSRRADVKAGLLAEVQHLKGRLLELKADGPQAPALTQIAQIASSLANSLGELDQLVSQRLEASERLATSRRDLFETSAKVQRLLAPWLQVLNYEIAVPAAEAEASGRGGEAVDRRSLIQLQQRIQTAQRQTSAAVDMLAEASTTENADRIPILAFQLGLALDVLDATAASLDSRLRPLFLEQLSNLRQLATGPNSIADTRMQELGLVTKGKTQLTATATLSSRLTVAVDQLGQAAKQDIGWAIQDALGVQRLSARVLVALVVLSLLTSILIVWRYVGGNIVRRLTALSGGMRAIAGGNLRIPVETSGVDEIAAMGRAVEVFRQNTLERDALLAEKAGAAERLEKEVKERTAELELANRFKSRFLAAASHDLRQPLHALNLFAAQLRADADAADQDRLVGRINAAVGAMNELFEGLLDMSKLEAGVLEPDVTEFPIERLFDRIEATFADAAHEKGLRLVLVQSSAWIRSDFVLLERILFNFVSNTVRYTMDGGMVIGSRHRGGCLRIDVCDTGPGIQKGDQRDIFGEFFQAAGSDRKAGLGLGLAIVERLGHLLNHQIELESEPGRGSRFSVSVPRVIALPGAAEAKVPSAVVDPVHGKLIVVIDDDPLVLESMGGILQNWGCEVMTADGGEAALEQVMARPRQPDLIIADYRLAGGRTGVQAITLLRDTLGAAVPAFLISGDTAPECIRDANANGCTLLHKPVAPMQLRAIVNQRLKALARDDITAAAK